MQISYYVKQRIIHYFIHVIMIFLLVLTLLPIGWMIYASFKENTDILVGKISLSRSRNNVIFLDSENNYIFVGCSDGGLNKFDRKTGKINQFIQLRTAATCYTCDKNYIWASSSNRGLIRISKSNLKNWKEFPLPLKNFDQSKVANTFVLKDNDTIWFTMRYKGFESIFKFDTKQNAVTKIVDLTNELSPVQITSIWKVDESIWVGTDKGLLKVDLKQEKVVKTFKTIEILPQGVTSLANFENKIIFGGSTGIYVFDPNIWNIINSYKKENGLISNNIEFIKIHENYIYVGTNAGLSIIDTLSGEIRNFESLFYNLNAEGDPIPGSLYPASVTYILPEENSIILGSTFGRFSLFDTYLQKVTNSYLSHKGYIVIAWRNYIDMWKNINFGLYLRNSFIICGATMVIGMIFATLAAYAISRFRFPGANLFSLAILATQMVPGVMYLIPIYITFIKFHEWTGIPLKGTFFGIIFIYSAYFVPFSIWILRGFFAAIPIELEEAARIDGCSPIQVFWHIVLPLAIPGIIATGIYVFLVAWDELMLAWMLTSADTMTIPVGIRNFVGNYQNRFDLLMAASTVATVPVLVLFFLLQKHIVRGLTAGAVKG